MVKYIRDLTCAEQHNHFWKNKSPQRAALLDHWFLASNKDGMKTLLRDKMGTRNHERYGRKKRERENGRQVADIAYIKIGIISKETLLQIIVVVF